MKVIGHITTKLTENTPLKEYLRLRSEIAARGENVGLDRYALSEFTRPLEDKDYDTFRWRMRESGGLTVEELCIVIGGFLERVGSIDIESAYDVIERALLQN